MATSGIRTHIVPFRAVSSVEQLREHLREAKYTGAVTYHFLRGRERRIELVQWIEIKDEGATSDRDRR